MIPLRDQQRRDRAFGERGGDDDSAAVETVRDQTGQRREQQRGQEEREPDEAQVEGAVADRIDLPRDRDALDLIGDVEQDDGREIAAEGA
jgi:hypothetical protein